SQLMDFTFVSVRAFTPLQPTVGQVNFTGSDYNGVPTLTSLALEYKNKRVELLECIVTINQEKNIVTTPMQGRDGTIKEYISDGDYAITIDAAVNSYNEADFENSKAYPKEKLDELIRFFKVKDGLEIQSDFLTLFGIHSAVIKTYGMVQETHSNRQSFQIQMLSDTPYEIKIQQDATISK
ncbi:DUF6046 domain-containing protein, partial [Microcoleus sp. herbarium8]